MTVEEMNECADMLEGKAEGVQDGVYGPADPGEDESWIGDLRHAAYLLREGRIQDLNQSEREEIEAIGYSLEEPTCCCSPYAWNPLLAKLQCPIHGDQTKAIS